MSSSQLLRRIAAALLIPSLAALAILGLSAVSHGPDRAQASHAGGMDAMRIDLDPSALPANTATSLGSVETCRRINENNLTDADETSQDTLTMDITASVIPASNPMIAFSYAIPYNETAMTIQSTNNSFLLAVNAGSSLFNANDPAPDTNGNNQYIGGALDTGAGIPEFGSGVLTRHTISSDAGAAAGLYPLSLNQPVHVDSIGNAYQPDNLNADSDGDTALDSISNVATIAIDTPCPLPPVDIELVSLSLTSIGGPTFPVGAPFTLEVVATANNNGPNPADIQIDTDIPGLPADCNKLPNGPQSEAFPALPPAGVAVSTRDWTVTCSDPSNHNFSGSGSVTVTGLAQEVNPGNNGPLTDPEAVAITATSDPKVTGVSVTAPPTAATGAPFNVSVQANIHNNGPLTPINVDTTFDLIVPVGCSRVPNAPQIVDNTSLVMSIVASVQKTWVVTCTTTGLKTFNGTADVSLDQLHVMDSNPNNNSGSNQASTDTSLAQADVKVMSVTVSAPPSALINTNFPVIVNTLVHNNGPFAPVNADITLTLNLPPDCFTPVTTIVFQDASLGPSIAAQLPSITFFVGCTNHSFHNITATATIVIDDPLAGDPNPGNNVLTSAPSTVAVIRTADLKVLSATVTAPATGIVGTPFNVAVNADLHNNGPDPAPVGITVTLNMPPDCTTPTNPKTLSLTLPMSTLTAIPTQNFPVTCSTRSNHNFDATVTLTPPLHVNDTNPGNNSVTSNTATVGIFAESDLKITGVVTTVPPSAVVGVPFTVSAVATVHNNGPFGPANGDVALTLSLPPDCSTADPNPTDTQDVLFPVSTPTPINGAWTVTCTQKSLHSFSTSATVVLDEFHVLDPNPGNNSGSSPSVSVPVFALADGKILSTVIPNQPTNIPANTNITITVRKMLHNNGPFGPTNFSMTKSHPNVPGCTITQPPTTNHNLAFSVATLVDEIWTINCAVGTYTITFNNTLTPTDLHVSDPDTMNNSSSVSITVFVDTDGDGIPDNVEVACGSNPNNGLSIPERIDGIYAGVDDDLDVAIDEALPAGAAGFDCDRDGYIGTTEGHVYTPSTRGDQDPCGSNNGPPTVPPSPLGWPADLAGGFFSANKINVQDISTYVAPVRYLNTNVGTNPGDVRWDVVPGAGPFPTNINIQDLTNISIVKPPMLGSVRAFNGPDCPFPP